MHGLNFISLIYVILTYVVFLIFIIGVGWRIIDYTKTPMPVKIALTPAPKTAGGAFWRIVSEVVFFKSLYKSNKSIWIAGYVFHISFFIVLLQHLLRHYVYDFSNGHPPAWYGILIPVGAVFGILMLISLFYLFLRRIFVDRIKFISIFADYFILLLLMAIIIAGLSEIAFQPATQLEASVVQLDVFFNRLLAFAPVNIPTDPFFLFHYSLVLILIGYIPFSKIMHFVGIFFSPTIAMVDNPREARHVDERADRLTI